jgi:hypothetical protein
MSSSSGVAPQVEPRWTSPTWIRTKVLQEPNRPAAREPFRDIRNSGQGLIGDDLRDLPTHCEYCGFPLRAVNMTRRKRFCSDTCRVTAWRLKRRRAAAVT